MNIKELLGDKYKDTLTADEKLALLETLNLADLSSGNYVDKGKIDAKNGEIAKLQETINSYKKKEFESLDDAQKKDVEYQNLAKANKDLQDLIAEYKLKDTIMSSGYTADECNQIIEASKAGKDLAPIYANIMKTRTDEAVKSAKAELTKNGVPPAPDGSDSGTNPNAKKSEDVLMAEMIAKSTLNDDKSIDSIKEAYSSIGKDN